MKRVLIGLLAVVTVSSLAAAQDAHRERTIERPFTEGGHVRLNLASADYTIRDGASDRIVVHWHPDGDAKVKELKKLRVDVQLSGATAIVFTDGPAKHVRFTIEIPSRADVYLRMKGGEVRVDGIEGHKDIRMTAGELTIGIRPESLSRVHASVTFGDLDADPLGISKGGIKQSLDWHGAGGYTLDARLFAGDLTLSHQR